MPNHWFTPRSARQALDTVRPAAETLCRVYRALERARPECIVPDQRVDRAYFVLVTRLYMALGEIRRRGVRVLDLRRGVLDFPARRAGRPVVLSWRVGEATVGHWRDPEARDESRFPLDEDGPWEEA